MDRTRIAFFVKEGTDSYLNDIIEDASEEYEVRKVVVEEPSEIDQHMQWSNICWFERCDDLAVYGTRLAGAFYKKLICRISSNEVFSGALSDVNWTMIDKAIFASSYICDYAVDKFNIPRDKTVVIPNGVNLKKVKFEQKSNGYNIAYIGNLNFKRGPMLLLHTFEAMHRREPRYKLHIAGQFQEEKDALYFNHMIREMKLENAVIIQGMPEDVDQWLEDKDYILCTSQLESQSMSTMVAMAKGIKPIIHNFVGARDIYPDDYIFNTIPEAVSILQGDYKSQDYRRFIEMLYDRRIIWGRLNQILTNLKEKEWPLVSVVMPAYNSESYLNEAVTSVLEQSYDNLELIVVDDGSTDGTSHIIESFYDTRIKYVYKEHSGQLDALKSGFEQVAGDYIARVDSSDKVHPEYIEECLKEMEARPELDFVFTDSNLIDQQGRLMQEYKYEDFQSPQELIKQMFSRFSSLIPDVAFFRKGYIGEVITNYCQQNIPYYMDTIESSSYGHVRKCLYYNRQLGNNLTVNIDNYTRAFESRIKSEDFIIRKYFVQRDILNGFKRYKDEYYRLFAEYFESLRDQFKKSRGEVHGMLDSQERYWRKKLSGYNEMPEGYKYSNFRIAVVSADNPMGGCAIGGKHTHVSQLCRALDSLGTVNYLIAYEHKPDATVDIAKLKKWLNKDIDQKNIVRSPNLTFACLVYSIEKQLEERIKELISRKYVSCISAQDVISATAATSAINQLGLHIPVVTTLHGYFTRENIDYGGLTDKDFMHEYFMEYERQAVMQSDCIIAVDSRIGDYAREMSEGRVKVEVMKNAVDEGQFMPCIHSKEMLKNVFLVPRRLVPKNGVIYAVSAVKKLIDSEITEFQLIIAGDGIERVPILEYIKKNNLENNISYLGPVPHDEMLQYYRAAKAVIVPSVESNGVQEATSIAVLEAMACGRIPIVSNIGGLKELVRDGENGIVVEPCNIDALAQAMARVIEMSDEDTDGMGAFARKEIEESYGYISHAARFTSLLCKITEELDEK